MRQHVISIMTLLFCLVIFLPDPVVAAANNGSVTDWLKEDGDEPSEPQEEPVEVEGANTNIFFLLIKLVFYTIVVVGLIYLLIRFLSKRQQKLQHHSVFTPIGGTPLGNNKSVQLVKVGDSLYMIGVGDNVNLLKEIEDKEEVESILEQAEEQNSGFSFMNQKQTGVQEMIQASLKKQRNKRKNYWDDGDERDDK
ncbi:flagellar biosynthetic protein FliO [Bacillus sp. es.036]|uniref:flagellar biosynthetic protein FliO n=1 Tax=Bacillus sp. es.036 TaxID=1761764 RepID=UPI000BF494B3|nr:flagellar biosynthetic protein FliO [Bacillus sp. es.036]PFG15267.1 flagellar protein FliO/FliZ [Bacillus sp. es.036]